MGKKLAAGNWKMNGSLAALSELDTLSAAHSESSVEIVICPPAPLIQAASGRNGIRIGGQDCHAATSGAYTGDTSAGMLVDAGAQYVILGHSERREGHRESDADVRAKTQTAWEAGLRVILCVGESEAERDADNTLDIIAGQLSGSVPDGASADTLVIAYEPIWAIGTGRVPSSAQIREVHDLVRARMVRRFGQMQGNAIRLLYGGSVKGSNAAEIFAIANVDGALVGGASLKSDDFSAIITALEHS